MYGVLSACVAVPCVDLVPKTAREDVGCPRTEVVGSCEPLCGFQEPIPGSLGEQQVLLTAAELSLQPLLFFLNLEGFGYLKNQIMLCRTI